MSAAPVLRIGQGFDVHRFGPGDHVMLGGVRIAHEQGVISHSDGDVILHALADAVLGAAGLGDIGRLFPDDDPLWAGADSGALLRSVVESTEQAGWRVFNADCTLLAERPKIAAHVPAMRENVAAALRLDGAAVNVKATTTECLGFVGRGEGLAALAVVLLTPA